MYLFCSLGLRKHQDTICKSANPVVLAVNLLSRDLISQHTKDRALQIIGIDNYQKNAEMLNEVENAIKADSTKLPIFCQVLHAIPSLKQYGVKILKEAGLSVHTTLLQSQHHQVSDLLHVCRCHSVTSLKQCEKVYTPI